MLNEELNLGETVKGHRCYRCGGPLCQTIQKERLPSGALKVWDTCVHCGVAVVRLIKAEK